MGKISHIIPQLYAIIGPCFLLGLIEGALALLALVSLPAGDPELHLDYSPELDHD